MSFTVNLFLLALLSAAAAFVFGYAVQRWPRLYTTLPRERYIGTVLGIICLIWAASHVAIMLEGDAARFRILINLLVPVVAVLSFIHLDYIFTRALGGLLLLMVNLMLQQGFIARVPMRPLFSILLYMFGIAGLFMVSAPWKFRDLLEYSGQSKSWRHGLVAVMASLALIFVIFAVSH